jgi:Putative peptidoglycan binding domain
MKTSVLSLFALTISAALAIPVQAGNRGGGGGFAGGHFAATHSAAARGGAMPSFRSTPARSFGGGRMIYSGQRFSSVGMRSASSAAFSQRYMNSYRPTSIAARQFTPRNIDRGGGVTRFGTNPLLAQGGTSFGRSNRAIANRGIGARQIRHGNNLPANWRNHVVAQRSADWHRDWDRGRDHWWHGHHCRFINGSWVIFDFGFYPWWPYWYPYDYYAYDYYPYPSSYDPGYNYYDRGFYDSGYYDPDVDQGEQYYNQNGYESSDQNIDSTVVAAQDLLARRGYYRGQIDGVLDAETRRAIARYQSNHGLRVTGYLTTDTLQALGLPQVASN